MENNKPNCHLTSSGYFFSQDCLSRNKSLVFYDHQIGEYINPNLVIASSIDMDFSILGVDNLTFNTKIVSQILRII